MGVRVAIAALAAGFATALLMGCGIDTAQESKSGKGAATTATTGTGTATVDEARTRTLPKRGDGVVAVEGPAIGSLTPRAIAGVSGVRVNYAGVSESQGFDDLCRGRIDVLDTSRVITAAEARLCKRNGLEVVEPIQVASDAVVIATRNESDVGGDCLRMTTVEDIFGAGSPITNWSQVGFFNIPLRTTGPAEDRPAFQFFAQRVFGVPANSSISDMRSDYILRTNDDNVRREVTSETRVRRVNARFRSRIRELELDRSIALQATVDRAIRRAQRRVLDEIDRENQDLADREVRLTETQKLLIRRRNLRRINAATRAAQNRALDRFTFPQLTFTRARYRQALRGARLSGTIGIFRFSYYERYENLLRPMEIWDPETAAAALEAMNGVRVVRGNTPTTTTTTATTPTTSTSTTSSTTGTTETTTTATTTAPTETTEDGDVIVNADMTPWCVFPSQTTITNGSYPLSRRLLLYVTKLNLEREEVKTFLRTYVENARDLATANRLVPIPDTLKDRNNDLIEDGDVDAPSTTPSGTTTTSTTSTTTLPDDNVPGVGTGRQSTTSTGTTTTDTTTTP